MTDLQDRADRLGRLWWITDAPMFIDGSLTAKIHDAIVWPELQQAYEEKTAFKRVKETLEGKAGLKGGADFKLPGIVEWLGPRLKAKAAIEGAALKEDEQHASHVVRGHRVESDERKLHEIVVEYLAAFPERLLFLDVPGGRFSNVERVLLPDDLNKLLESPPRPLVFVNMKKGSPIFPTVAEMEGGGFRPIYQKLDEKLLSGLNPTPRYDDKNRKKRAEYWGALKSNFSSRTAMQELEKACDNGRIGWIDFRILFNDEGDTGHLHIVPAGKSHVGLFGYNFVHRGYKYGSRAVASLKSGMDLNVLALYEC